MSKNIYLFSAVIVFIATTFAFTGCKSGSNNQDTVTAAVNDTTAVADTVKTAHEPNSDTVKAGPVLTLIINKLTSTTAPVVVGVYGVKNKFPDPKDQLKEYTFRPTGKSFVAKITNLPFGTYALALYQDVNSNGKIDKNLLGIPTEVYGFSNNYKPLIKAPAFKDCSFIYTANADTLHINMLK